MKLRQDQIEAAFNSFPSSNSVPLLPSVLVHIIAQYLEILPLWEGFIQRVLAPRQFDDVQREKIELLNRNLFQVLKALDEEGQTYRIRFVS